MIDGMPGIGRFAVSHAFLLLGRGSAEHLSRHNISGVHDSVYFGDGSGWCLAVLAGADLGYTARLEAEAMEKLCLKERAEFRRVAKSMVNKSELTEIPYFLQKSSGSWVALPETFSDVLCEGRQAIAILYGKKKLKAQRVRIELCTYEHRVTEHRSFCF